MDATVGVGVREGAGRDAGLIPEALVGRDWSFAQWMSYFEFMHDLSTGQAPLTVRERITVSSRLLAPWHVGSSLSIRLYAAALWAWVWFWFMLAVVWLGAFWGVCFLVRPFWTWRELRAVRARLAAKRHAWLAQRKSEKFDNLIGELGIGDVGGGRKEPSLIHVGRLVFLAGLFPIIMVLWVVELTLQIFQAVTGWACILLREIVLFPDRIPNLGWKMLFAALLFPINIVLVPIHLTLRTFHTLAGMARILLREPAKMSKQISVIGVSGYIRYLFGFYVFMARDFVPNLKNSWKMAFEGKTWRINVPKT